MAELDDAYANRAYIDDADDYPPRWEAEAQGFRDALGDRARIGLPYGEGARHVFDYFVPEGEPQGTLIFVHGGYWRMFDQTSWSHLAAGALARGWAVAMPTYDLCPDVRISDITRQIARAVRAVAAMTDGPISLAGHSAGGHLVSRMLDPDLVSGSIAARLHAVVPISPLSDLRPLRRTSMNADFKMDEEAAIAESPIFTDRRHPARVAVWVGAEERPAFLDQARWLSEAWEVDLVIPPDRHHFDVIDALAEPDSNLVRLLTG